MKLIKTSTEITVFPDRSIGTFLVPKKLGLLSFGLNLKIQVSLRKQGPFSYIVFAVINLGKLTELKIFLPYFWQDLCTT